MNICAMASVSEDNILVDIGAYAEISALELQTWDNDHK